jgi:hypothetical protein
MDFIRGTLLACLSLSIFSNLQLKIFSKKEYLAAFGKLAKKRKEENPMTVWVDIWRGKIKSCPKSRKFESLTLPKSDTIQKIMQRRRF